MCNINLYLLSVRGKRNRVHLTTFRLYLTYAKNLKCAQTLNCYQFYQANHKIKEAVIPLIYLAYLQLSTTFKNALRRHHFLTWRKRGQAAGKTQINGIEGINLGTRSYKISPVYQIYWGQKKNNNNNNSKTKQSEISHQILYFLKNICLFDM